MNDASQLPDLRMIPIERIDVLNTRERNAGAFSRIVQNIEHVGLKKPITVTPRPGSDGAERYLLVCGEGRLKALKELGQSRIPALVVNVPDEDAFIMSLTENLARRHYRPLELLTGITELRQRGYPPNAIAEKTGLSGTYVRDILVLVDEGEQRLLAAVQRGQIPVGTALHIVGAGDDDAAVQAALQGAYESGVLKGRQLLEARRVVQRRQISGRTISTSGSPKHAELTTSSLVRTYQREVQRQRLMVRKAAFAQQRLVFIAGALRRLFLDENFVNLLKAEGLDSVPEYLAQRIASSRHPS
jgi:ParB family transcriptional regulator, chromosome partitioning protein